MNTITHVALTTDALPSDVTTRTPIYRRRGIIAGLILDLVVRIGTPPAPRRRRRRSGTAPPLSEHMRRDIGLTSTEPRSPVWDDIPWK